VIAEMHLTVKSCNPTVTQNWLQTKKTGSLELSGFPLY